MPSSERSNCNEHQVPELEVAAAVITLVKGDQGLVRPAIDEQLTARTARTGIAHRPEVVLGGAAHNPLLRQARDGEPQIEGFVVLFEDGRPQMLLGNAPDLGHQLPGELDGFGFEVVTEGEVAEHLEERVVTRARTDVLQIVVLARHAQTLLRGDCTRPLRLLDAEKVVLELHHAGVGEQQCRVAVRHHRGALMQLVPALDKEVDEAAANVVALHGGRPSRDRRARWRADPPALREWSE